MELLDLEVGSVIGILFQSKSAKSGYNFRKEVSPWTFSHLGFGVSLTLIFLVLAWGQRSVFSAGEPFFLSLREICDVPWVCFHELFRVKTNWTHVSDTITDFSLLSFSKSSVLDPEALVRSKSSQQDSGGGVMNHRGRGAAAFSVITLSSFLFFSSIQPFLSQQPGFHKSRSRFLPALAWSSLGVFITVVVSVSSLSNVQKEKTWKCWTIVSLSEASPLAWLIARCSPPFPSILSSVLFATQKSLFSQNCCFAVVIFDTKACTET